jgi:hypothetical protein
MPDARQWSIDCPYNIVRFKLHDVQPRRQLQLARLADKYGAEIDLPSLLGMIAGDCKCIRPRRASMVMASGSGVSATSRHPTCRKDHKTHIDLGD